MTKKKLFLLTAVLIISIFALVSCSKKNETNSSESVDKHPESLSWVQENTTLSLDSDFGENIYSIKKDESILPYNEYYRAVIDVLLEDVMEESHSFDTLLLYPVCKM